jgi:2-polyprenyl-3-methyl-5-hydroxy-6-metoxy-1,4-benzoquinol methylase
MSDLFRPLRSFLIKVYYRLLFDRRGPFVDEISRIVRVFESDHGAGDIPVSAAVWESQYRTGRWEWLNEIGQVPHNSVLAGFVRFLKPRGRVLDVGCGEGALRNLLGSAGYMRYVGIDCSETAIATARKHEDACTSFAVCDATEFVPTETFDAVVFNESLYYFEDPVAVFDRFVRRMNPNGVVLTSLFLTPRASAILKRLKRLYPLLDEVSLTNEEQHTWVCCAFQVRQQPAFSEHIHVRCGDIAA